MATATKHKERSHRSYKQKEMGLRILSLSSVRKQKLRSEIKKAKNEGSLLDKWNNMKNARKQKKEE